MWKHRQSRQLRGMTGPSAQGVSWDPEDQPPGPVPHGEGGDGYSLILQGGVTSRHSLCAPTPHLVHR